MRVRKLCCGILLLLVACAGGEPVSQSTSYILPATPGGRMCVDQCNKSRDYCQESCTLDYRACYNDIQASAQHAYDAYSDCGGSVIVTSSCRFLCFE